MYCPFLSSFEVVEHNEAEKGMCHEPGRTRRVLYTEFFLLFFLLCFVNFSFDEDINLYSGSMDLAWMLQIHVRSLILELNIFTVFLVRKFLYSCVD